MKIKTAEACYSGGGIYIYIGAFTDGSFFLADDEVSVTIVDAMPDFEESFTPEWIASHLVRFCTYDEAVALYPHIVGACIKALHNGADMNAQESDLISRKEN